MAAIFKMAAKLNIIHEKIVLCRKKFAILRKSILNQGACLEIKIHKEIFKLAAIFNMADNIYDLASAYMHLYY